MSGCNYVSVPAIAGVLESHPNIRRWSLLEFAPLGDGYASREKYALTSDVFWDTVRQASQNVNGLFEVDGFGNSAKPGTYALVTPSARLYGTESAQGQLGHRFVGNVLTDHLSDLAENLPFDRVRHEARYG